MRCDDQAAVSRPKAYSYVRFSTPEQARGDSLHRQTEGARRYAASKGLEFDESLSFRDLGVSAHHGRNAEVGALGAFLEAVREGRVAAGSFLLVESLDRISRQTVRKAVRTLESIVDTGIVVVDLSDNGRAYSVETLETDPFAFIMMALRFIRAHEESATKGMRVAAAYDKKRTRAAAKEQLDKPFTRMLPAWLRWDDESKAYAVIEGRAKVISDIFEKADSGWGQHKIAHWLNGRGIEPWAGAVRWHRSYVRKILRNSAVVGIFTPHKAVKGPGGVRRRIPLDAIPGYWPAVVDPELFQRVWSCSAAAAPKGRNAHRAPASIFAGVLRCSHCAGSVVRVAKGPHVYLVCSRAHAKAGCKYQAVRYADVVSTVTVNAASICDGAPRGAQTSELEEEIRNLDEALYQLRLEAEDLVDELARTRSEAVRNRLREKERVIEECERASRDLSARREILSDALIVKRLAGLREALEAKPINIAATNKALKGAVERIVLSPETGELSLHWRHAPTSPRKVRFHSRHNNPFLLATEHSASTSSTGNPLNGQRAAP
jgi:DNA invertase Pin-like site-specific DNA recombinase